MQNRFKNGANACCSITYMRTLTEVVALLVLYKIRAFLNDRNHAVGVLVVRVLQLFANIRLAKEQDRIHQTRYLLQTPSFQNQRHICRN